jgi:hypothetical protein
MKQRMDWGTFHLTPEDVKSFLAGDESANAIGRRKGGSSSLVTYHLRKLNDPKINEVLQLNANRASADFKNNRLAKVKRMLKRGCSSTEILDTCHIATATLTKVRKEMGLYDPRRSNKKPKQVAVPGQPLSALNTLIVDVIDTNVFRVLTKKWPIELEQPTERAA